MATLNFGIAPTRMNSASGFRTTTKFNQRKSTIVCVGWDPENLLPAPHGGHIARYEFRKSLENDSDAREAFERQVRQEKERLQAIRESREVPDTPKKLIEYFLDTEAQDFEFEIARMRPRLNQEFFSELKSELGQIRFAVNKTKDMEDRVVELEALEKAIQEGKEAYDKMQADLTKAKENLTKILTSKDVKATLLDMVESNEINRTLLTLLDENIASAHGANQTQAAEFMQKLRGAVLKYMTI